MRRTWLLVSLLAITACVPDNPWGIGGRAAGQVDIQGRALLPAGMPPPSARVPARPFAVLGAHETSPLAGAEIRLVDPADGQPWARTTADAAGGFRFSILAGEQARGLLLEAALPGPDGPIAYLAAPLGLGPWQASRPQTVEADLTMDSTVLAFACVALADLGGLVDLRAPLPRSPSLERILLVLGWLGPPADGMRRLREGAGIRPGQGLPQFLSEAARLGLSLAVACWTAATPLLASSARAPSAEAVQAVLLGRVLARAAAETAGADPGAIAREALAGRGEETLARAGEADSWVSANGAHPAPPRPRVSDRTGAPADAPAGAPDPQATPLVWDGEGRPGG